MNTKNENLEEFLNRARKGELESCQGCPRRPTLDNLTVFSENCKAHFASSHPLIMCLTRDPAGSPGGSARTQVNCFYCNTDQTAQNVLHLFNKYLRIHGITPRDWYATNAVKHGTIGENKAPDVVTIQKCSKVLEGEIQDLKPKIIIAFGKEAAESLAVISYFKNYRSTVRDMVADAEGHIRPPCRWLYDTYVAVLPHPSNRGINNYGWSTVEGWWKQLGQCIRNNCLIDRDNTLSGISSQRRTQRENNEGGDI